jgi:cysteine-rich repeat protein
MLSTKQIAMVLLATLVAACGSQVIYEGTGGHGGASSTASGSSAAGMDGPQCGNGKVEAGEQCDDGANNGATGDPCKTDCTIDLPNPCGNGKVDPGEECDLGMANSCADGTASPCTCTCKNKKCGDGVVQVGECCDDANGGGQMSKCNLTCTGCKNPNDPSCKCATGTSSSTGCECPKTKIFKSVVSSQLNPSMQGAGLPSAWSYKGFLGVQAGKALCQDVGADHACTYEEVAAADAKGELAALPQDLTYWLHRTTNVPDYTQNNGNKPCFQNSDCGSPDVCDPVTKVCSWKPGAAGRCNDWTYTTNHVADGEWFRTLPDPQAGGGVAKGTLSFHFLQDASSLNPMGPVCKSETVLGCAGPCAGPTRAILCCFPNCQC